LFFEEEIVDPLPTPVGDRIFLAVISPIIFAFSLLGNIGGEFGFLKALMSLLRD
jgi:hypothetical protein